MNAVQKWMKRLRETSPITVGRHELISLRRVINGRHYDYETRKALFDFINEIACERKDGISPMLVDSKQTDEGLQWCGSVLKRLTGKKKDRVFEDDQMQDILELAKYPMFREFRFGGLMDYTTDTARRYHGLIQTVPIWQIIPVHGRMRSYAYGSWQSNIGYVPDPKFSL